MTETQSPPASRHRPGEPSHDELAWGMPATPESTWPATFAVVAAMALYWTLPDRLTLGPTWVIPVLEASILVPLRFVVPKRHPRESKWVRVAAIVLIGVVTAANVVSLVLLIEDLLSGSQTLGRQLIFAAMQVWLTNVIVFGLWYWELDRGGPAARGRHDHDEPDFLFPQMSTPAIAAIDWSPRFVDYLFVAFTNATAFSPTDTLPLTHSAKLLMGIQAGASLLTVAVVAGRAVNILQ